MADRVSAPRHRCKARSLASCSCVVLIIHCLGPVFLAIANSASDLAVFPKPSRASTSVARTQYSLFSPFVLVFALNAFREQSRANSDDALAHPSGLDSVGDGVIAAEFGGAAIKQEGKVDAVVIIIP